MGFLLVCLGASAGAPARYLLDRAIQTRHTALTPWGTLAVNLSGSLLLGFLVGLGPAGAGERLLLLLGTGFCGTFTTYSTFSFETIRLLEDRAFWPAFGNLALTMFGGLGAAMVGFALAAPW